MRRISLFVLFAVLGLLQTAHAQTLDDTPLWHSCASAKLILQHALNTTNKTSPAALLAKRRLGFIALEEGDDTALMEYWKPVFLLSPDSPITTACWQAFVHAAERLGREADILAVARAIVANPRSSPLLRTSAQDNLAYYNYRSGKNVEADALWNSEGYIRNWRIIGPFENVSHSGLEHVYGPEEKIDLMGTCMGVDGQQRHWHPAALLSRDGTVRLSASLSDNDEEVFYAATAINAPHAGPASLRFDMVGASEIFVNGHLISRDSIYRDQQPAFANDFSLPVTLQAGWNTILVKVCDDSDHTGAFRMRVTAPEDPTLHRFAIDPTHCSSAPSPDTGSTSAPLSAPQPTVVSALQTYVTQNPKDIEACLWLGIRQRESGDYEAGIATLRTALANQPESAFLHWELSMALKLNGQTDEAQQERDIALHQDERLIDAQLDFDEEQNKPKPASERLQWLKSLIAHTNPRSEDLLWALARAYKQAGLNSDARETVRRIATLSPGEPTQFRIYNWYLVEKRNQDANQLLRRLLVKYPGDEDLVEAEARNLADNGDPAAIALFRRVLTLNEPDLEAYDALTALLIANHNLTEAARILAQARRVRPQNADICAQLADVEKERGNKQAAMALYQEAVRLDPSRVELRDRLQLLSGVQPIASLVPPTDIKPILAHLPRAKDYPGVSQIRVLDEGRTVVYPDFAQVAYNREIITVLDDAAVQEYQRYPIGGSTGTAQGTAEVARIIKPDGKIVNCLDQANSRYAAFPSLAPGDTIDLLYRVEDYPRQGLAGKFWGEWFFSEESGPVRLSRYVLITPRNMEINSREHGGIQPATVRDSGNWRIREWRDADIPATKLEPLAPPHRDWARWVDVSTIHSWKEIADWYQALSGPRCQPDTTIRAKAAELTKGLKTEDEKISAVVTFVAEKIQYQSNPFRMSAYIPTEGKVVLRDAYGDCKDKAALITAMLQSVGIHSRMALLSPRDVGITPYLPGPRFNHAIAVVDTAHGPVWVDGTAQSLTFGELPITDQGVPALIIDSSTTDLTEVPLQKPESSQVTETVEATLKEDGTLSAKEDMATTGTYAWLLRSAFRSIPEANRDQVLRTIGSQFFENAQVHSTELVNLETPTQPLILRFVFDVPGYAQTVGKLLLTHFPWGGSSATGLGSLATLRAMAAARTQDAEFIMGRGKQMGHIKLTLPAGYVLKEIPQELKGESAFGSYHFTFQVNGNTLVADKEIVTLPLRVAAKDVSDYLTFAEAVEKPTKNPILLEKP